MKYVAICFNQETRGKEMPRNRSLASRRAGPGATRRNTPQSGFTLTEIMIVVAIIGLLAAIAIPNLIRARSTAQTKSCISNLKQIYGAKNQWAFENRREDKDTPTEAELSPYFNDQKMPACPGAGRYQIKEVADLPKCSLRDEGHDLRDRHGPPDNAVANGLQE